MSLALLRCLPPTTLGDAAALDAARKLKRQLPVRNHLAFIEEARTDTGHKKRVEYQGEIYDSIRKAALAAGVSSFTMAKWIEAGKATVVPG